MGMCIVLIGLVGMLLGLMMLVQVDMLWLIGLVVDICWIVYGVLYIWVKDECGLGYGIGYVYVCDNVCLLVEEIVIVCGEWVCYFGSEGKLLVELDNLLFDIFYVWFN